MPSVLPKADARLQNTANVVMPRSTAITASGLAGVRSARWESFPFFTPVESRSRPLT
jgi:hypothetical protein